MGKVSEIFGGNQKGGGMGVICYKKGLFEGL